MCTPRPNYIMPEGFHSNDGVSPSRRAACVSEWSRSTHGSGSPLAIHHGSYMPHSNERIVFLHLPTARMVITLRIGTIKKKRRARKKSK
jgi:hypothetical protein